MTKEEEKKASVRDLLSKQYEVLGHNQLGFTEVRLPKRGIQRFFRSESDYSIEVVQEYLNGDSYVGINPRKTMSGKAEDVSHVTAIVIDLDPVRPKDTSSSDDEHGKAISVGTNVFNQFPGSVLVSSGSGAHVYIAINPIEVKDKDKLTKALQAFNYEIKSKYETKDVKVDAVFDLPRIIRVWGSFNEKSKRVCQPIKGLDTYRRIDFDVEKYGRLSAETGRTINNSPKMDSQISNRFDKLLSINNNLKDMFNGVGKYASRSEADFALTSYLITAKFSDQEILDIRKKSPLSKSEDRTDAWILSDILRIKQKNAIKSSGISTIDDSYFKELDTRAPGILSGFPKLDQMMAGFKGGRLTVIGARPSDGKTTFTTQLAKNLAKNKQRVLIFPTECGASTIYDKIISSETGINLRKFQFGNFTQDEKVRINSIANDIKKLPIFVVENFALKIEDVEKNIKELVPDIVILDYLQSMIFPEGGSPSEMGDAVVRFKAMALKYNIPFILCSQLNRVAEGNSLSLTQLKGTGKLEEAGDDIMLLSTLDFNVLPRPVNLYIKKSKYGETGLVKYDFHANICMFKEKI